MADNTILNTGTGGDTIATDDIAGVKYPRSKIVIGADGTNDGDVSSSNPLPVSLASVPSHNVTNAGTFAVQASQTGTWAVTDGSGSLTVDAPVGTPVFVRLSDGTSAITALPITDNGGSVTVDGLVGISGSVTVTSHDVTNAGTFAVQVSSALPAGTNAIGKLAENSGVTIGAVEIAAAQTLATVTTVSTVTTCTTLTGSGVAHDGVDSGNPHKIGARAISSLSGATLVASADRTDLLAGVDGVLIVREHCNLEDIVNGVASITDGSSTSVIAAQGAGVKVYLTSVTISNSSTTDVTVDLRDGTAGTVKWTFPVPQTGGVTHTFNPPLPFSANTIIAADPSASASTVTVSLNGFRSKV